MHGSCNGNVLPLLVTINIVATFTLDRQDRQTVLSFVKKEKYKSFFQNRTYFHDQSTVTN